MVIYEVPTEKVETFRKNLNSQIYRDPLDVIYNCDLKVNGETYRLRFQMCSHRRLNPIQAIHMNRGITKCELITDPAMLETLIGLVVLQYGEEK